MNLEECREKCLENSSWWAIVVHSTVCSKTRPLELIDPFFGESCNASEAIRCIHISLLCLEHQPDDRPSMSSVVLMLGSDNTLPVPKQPGFLMDRLPQLELDSSNKPEFSSSNEVTISLLEAR
ncbi:hypothetical protein EZV62_008547 [Acer yangbiense]|uniref:S-locus receptor kinase C-terminal domain-containing protein n=1 Tax=Acer yangbiense TaxID=1000413 RepID=A0A5C7IEB2_9ROSI|nr:hypothetical protein EZV62_008547 [Acer yangbiense]